MNQIADRISEKLIKYDIIGREDKEIYTFGIEQLLFMLLNFFVLIIISYYINMILESLFFIGAYFPLRTYAGGFHARTQVRCFIFGTALVVGVLGILKIFQIPLMMQLSLLVASSIVIIIYAPVEHENRLLDNDERLIFRKRAIKTLAIEVIIILLLFVLGKMIAAKAMVIGITIEAFMIILAIAVQRYKRE